VILNESKESIYSFLFFFFLLYTMKYEYLSAFIHIIHLMVFIALINISLYNYSN
jgi:hypothetical protein